LPIDSNESLVASIHVCSNRPQQIVTFLEALQNTATQKASFEVLVNIDIDDTKMKRVLDEQIARRPFRIRYINQFEGGFYNSHVGYNALVPLRDPKAYFVVLLSDEMLFETQGWDERLREYIGYYPDHFFRVRASRLRFRNYTDYWESGFAPDSICFTTSKWLDACVDWGPCFSSDAFQQFVSFYLMKDDPFSKDQLNRDIPDPFLKFSGDVAAVGQSDEKQYNRLSGALKAWEILVSAPMQIEAKRRAMRIKARILAFACGITNPKISDHTSKQAIQYFDDSGQERLLSYRINRLKIRWTNLRRRFQFLGYSGGGEKVFALGFGFNFAYYLSLRYPKLRGAHHKFNHWKAIISPYGLSQIFRRRKEDIISRLYNIYRALRTKVRSLTGRSRQF
jgi:hypothetical protein